MYCDRCHLFIGMQKHVAHKKPGTQGDKPEDYLHFHNRERGDCYYLFLRDQVIVSACINIARRDTVLH